MQKNLKNRNHKTKMKSRTMKMDLETSEINFNKQRNQKTKMKFRMMKMVLETSEIQSKSKNQLKVSATLTSQIIKNLN